MEELILVDTMDRVVGSCEKLKAHREGRLHRAFSLFLYSGDRMLLHKRSRAKYHSGGLWSNACCSHPRAGESLEEAVSRRALEELGIPVTAEEVFSFVYRAEFANGLTEYEYDHVWIGRYDEDALPPYNPEEAEEMAWMSFSDLRAALVDRPERFSAWFLIAAPRVLDILEGREARS